MFEVFTTQKAAKLSVVCVHQQMRLHSSFYLVLVLKMIIMMLLYGLGMLPC